MKEKEMKLQIGKTLNRIYQNNISYLITGNADVQMNMYLFPGHMDIILFLQINRNNH